MGVGVGGERTSSGRDGQEASEDRAARPSSRRLTARWNACARPVAPCRWSGTGSMYARAGVQEEATRARKEAASWAAAG